MSNRIILLLSLWSLYSCVSYGLFAEQFLQESYKIKPTFATKEKILTKVISKYIKSYVVEIESKSLKTVDLDNIHENCNLDFEIELVQSPKLPASNHQIAHINIGGLLRPGQPANYKNFWSCYIGVVIEGNEEPNTVHSLLYHLTVDFKKSDLVKDSGLDLDDIDERDIASYLFYIECLRIYNEELSPIKYSKEEK